MRSMTEKRWIVSLLLLLLIPMTAVLAFAEISESDVVSETAIVMDNASGRVLFEKRMDQKMYPASITKILTAALALENGKETDSVTVTEEVLTKITYGVSQISLTPGEIISVQDLLYATMIESANDAANALAIYVSGSLEAFVKLMNQKAKEIGCQKTHFNNTNGLSDPNHVTTAYDMALITRYALSVPGFRTYFGAEEHTIQPTNMQSEQRKLGTYHHMLVTSKYYYEGTIGGKLGWTEEARHTAVTVARRNGLELICVVLDSADKWQKYKDSTLLFDDCFDRYECLRVAASEVIDTGRLISIGSEQVQVTFPPEQTFALCVPKGTTLQDLSYTLEGASSAETKDGYRPTIRFVQGGQIIYDEPVQVVFGEPEPVEETESEEETTHGRVPVNAPSLTAVVSIVYGLFFLAMFALYLKQTRHKRSSNVGSDQ